MIIFQQLKKKSASLTEADIDSWVLPGVMEYYDAKIKNLAHYIHRNQDGPVATLSIEAFKASAKEELRKALCTFYFKKEHWKNGRDPNPYLRTCLNYMSKKEYWVKRGGQSMVKQVCPACKIKGSKEICELDSGLLRCNACLKEVDRLADEMKNFEENSKEYVGLLARRNFYSMFSFHSRKGKACIACTRFIPNSIIEKVKVCPYEDCWYAGDFSQAKEMTHPSGVFARPLMSIDAPMNKDDDNSSSFHNTLVDQSLSAEDKIEMSQRYELEKKTLDKVIDSQIKLVKRMGSSGTKVQKLLMYQAFKNIIEKHPEDMVSYLVHVKQSADFPIQARVFQEYTRLIEDYLPFTMTKNGIDYEIFSLTDENLALFLGQSEYDAEVGEDYIIPNLTKEEYIGGRNFKNHGPCFIGKVIDILNLETQESILSQMQEYSFVRIKMASEVKPGTKVKVKHFRILPHYEMHSMVYLQRIRRHIVDRVYYHLHKKKRKVARNEIKT